MVAVAALRARMVHIPQAVVVEEQEAQGLLEVELLAVTVATLILRVRRKETALAVAERKAATKTKQASKQNTVEAEVLVAQAQMKMPRMVVALSMAQEEEEQAEEVILLEGMTVVMAEHGANTPSAEAVQVGLVLKLQLPMGLLEPQEHMVVVTEAEVEGLILQVVEQE